MKEEQSEAILFGEWLLNEAVPSYDGDTMCWEYDNELFSTRQIYILFINQQIKK